MEIKTIEEFFTEENKGKPWEYTHSDIEMMPLAFVKEVAIEYAQQFIDYASNKALVEETTKIPTKKVETYAFKFSEDMTHCICVNKQSILDIKQLIK